MAETSTLGNIENKAIKAAIQTALMMATDATLFKGSASGGRGYLGVDFAWAFAGDFLSPTIGGLIEDSLPDMSFIEVENFIAIASLAASTAGGQALMKGKRKLSFPHILARSTIAVLGAAQITANM